MDITNYLEKNWVSYILQSEIPESVKTEPCCLGIDEAGRGPVLGPMVYGICYCPVSFMEQMANLGFDDSKVLTAERREELLSVIINNQHSIGWAIKIISPTQISNDMLRRVKISLNELSHGAAIELTKRSIKDGVNVTQMFVDTVGPAEKYQQKLSKIFDGVEVTVTPKADAKFPVVSAASICAKVARDCCLEGWKFREGDFSRDYGCGYPSDGVTKKWLQNVLDPVFGFPQFVRFSWSTCSELLKKKAVDVTWVDDEEDEVAKTKTPITSFFVQQKNPQSINRCRFFKERKLEQVTTL